jgi:hypothetical protein
MLMVAAAPAPERWWEARAIFISYRAQPSFLAGCQSTQPKERIPTDEQESRWASADDD